MEQADDQAREIAELRDRLSRLSQASLRINESLDFDTVLQGVLDSACSLTGARYGVITLLDDSGRIQDFVTSGLTSEEHRRFTDLPEGMMFFEYLSRITEPLRLSDFHSYTRALGLPEFRLAQALSTGETVRAEEIVIEVSGGGRSPTTTGRTPPGTASAAPGSRRESRRSFFCTVCAVAASTVSFSQAAAISLPQQCPGRPARKTEDGARDSPQGPFPNSA